MNKEERSATNDNHALKKKKAMNFLDEKKNEKREKQAQVKQ